MLALRRALSVFVIAVSLLAVPGTVGGAQAKGERDNLFGPHTTPSGVSYERWLARWAVWLLEYPVHGSPADPDSPNNCERRPRIVYMGFNGTGRGCTVPQGKPIGLTFMAYECSTAEGNGETFRELRRCAVKKYRKFFGAKVAGVRLTIDGKRIEHPRRWTFTSSNRMVTLPKDNILRGPAGPTKTVSHGLFYMVKPLPPGEHLVRARVKFPETGAVGIFRYLFTVRART